jgi:nitrate reductase molybdenum cofactor assembly chaperone
MTANPIEVCDALARVLEYPTAEFADRLVSLRAVLCGTPVAATPHCEAFAAAVGSMSLAAHEELFIQTFDFNPSCTLDIGWQLFAEDYNRGLFLAKLRAESRQLGVAESCELPDHLPHVLRLLGRMDTAAAADLSATCVRPAVEKIQGALDEANPYRHLIQCVLSLVDTAFCQRAEVALT